MVRRDSDNFCLRVVARKTSAKALNSSSARSHHGAIAVTDSVFILCGFVLPSSFSQGTLEDANIGTHAEARSYVRHFNAGYFYFKLKNCNHAKLTVKN